LAVVELNFAFGAVSRTRNRVGFAARIDFLHRHFVFRQSSGFVGTDDGSAAEGFHCGQFADDRVAICHPGNAYG